MSFVCRRLPVYRAAVVNSTAVVVGCCVVFIAAVVASTAVVGEPAIVVSLPTVAPMVKAVNVS